MMDKESSFARNIKAIRQTHGLTQGEFARIIGATQTSVAGWESRGVVVKNNRIVDKLCSVFGITKQDIYGYSDGYYAKTYGLYNDQSKPAPMTAEANIEGTDKSHQVPDHVYNQDPSGYFVHVVDDSMNKAIPMGSLLYIAPNLTVSNGDIAALRIDDEYTIIRRIKSFDGLYVLEADSVSDFFKRQVIDTTDSTAPTVEIMGKAIWMCHEL